MSADIYQHKGDEIVLLSPITLPNACGFLWNKHMVAQVNCRGYMTSQFMQPEPAKYSHAPNLEAKTFIQPEQPFYTEHPGRFVFIKNEVTGEVLSAPYEPMKSQWESYSFSLGLSEINWTVIAFGVEIVLTLSLSKNKSVELWQIKVLNKNDQPCQISLYPYFTIGYMSWMNQSADYDEDLNAIVASSITPYQKVEQYFKNKDLKDKTVLIAERKPDSWTCSFNDFVGGAGLTRPETLFQPMLNGRSACYETPVAVMQYQLKLDSKQKQRLRFVFGPAKDELEIVELRQLLQPQCFEKEVADYQHYILQGKGAITIQSPIEEFNHFVNHWLPRQVYYHGDVNRLTTDPQTRNFVQDAMGMVYINSEVTKQRLLMALSQQYISGQMPDGILLSKDAELKYINQVPHADHCVWLPICLQAYLEETNDVSILAHQVSFIDNTTQHSVTQHIEKAIAWLLGACDERGLSLIEQGDWCDPMNMVGYKGKGVSAWLTLATSYAIKSWIYILEEFVEGCENERIEAYKNQQQSLNKAALQYFWQKSWLARGMTDEGRVFGTKNDSQGQIYLNPQSWAMLVDAIPPQQVEEVLTQVYQQLATPYGMTMLAPSYTEMVEDIGRLTQKSAGVAENGSIYNHAAVFFAYALYQSQKGTQAFDVLYRMLPNPSTAMQTGQLPNYVPNYYRGAYYQHQAYAGRSSQLFNTGTVSWFYRAIVDGLCGVTGTKNGIRIAPQLPDDWSEVSFTRKFRGAQLTIHVSRDDGVDSQQTWLNGIQLNGNEISNLSESRAYDVVVKLPKIQIKARELIIIIGVSGSGKTQVGKELARRNNFVFMDADDFHDDAAKRKMASGQALTDEDRLPWLARIATHLTMLAKNQQSVVLAYSGLKRAHREKFKQLDFSVQLVHLFVDKSTLEQRLNKRGTHFFDPKLLASQLDAFEALDDIEKAIVIKNTEDLEHTLLKLKKELSL